jgi:arsenate reductase
MAEGFARHKYRDLFRPESAGVWPAGLVQPATIAAMAEKGISVDGKQPRSLAAVDDAAIDLVVNMCQVAVLRMMPDFKGVNLVWHVPDPVGQPMDVYRKVRDQIEALVDELAENLRRQHKA